MTPRTPSPCGTRSAYVRGCRCDDCRHANLAYLRTWSCRLPPDATPVVRELRRADSWVAHAACAGQPASWFFPERGESTAEAKAICADCPVRVPCLEWALETNTNFGIWGGTSEHQRKRMRARQLNGQLSLDGTETRPRVRNIKIRGEVL